MNLSIDVFKVIIIVVIYYILVKNLFIIFFNSNENNSSLIRKVSQSVNLLIYRISRILRGIWYTILDSHMNFSFIQSNLLTLSGLC